jgi:hypothetical protein
MADERLPPALRSPRGAIRLRELAGPIEIRRRAPSESGLGDRRGLKWPKRRPCETKWVQDIIEQCPAAARVVRQQISVTGKSATPTAIAAELDRPSRTSPVAEHRKSPIINHTI